MFIYKHVTINGLSLRPFEFQRELAMEAYLIENQEVLALQTPGEEFKGVEIISNEFHLRDAGVKDHHHGRLDLLAKFGEDYLGIIELKLGRITSEHLKQLEAYLDQRDQIIKQQHLTGNDEKEKKWIGILVGNTIEPELMNSIRTGYKAEGDIPIVAMTINRFKDDYGNIFVITDSYFDEAFKGKDYSKYEFNGESYNKGRLVLAVIKYYVGIHPELSYSDLEREFPKELQGSEVFTTEEKAKDKTIRRNFRDESEILKLGDMSRIAVSTQWGAVNILKFIKRVIQLNLPIITIK